MPSSNPNKRNALGVTPSESKALPRRQPTSEEEKIIKSIKELYSCSPIPETYAIYSENAVFHDPIGYADNLDLIKSQFNGLPKLFKGGATVDRLEVLENPNGENARNLLIDQDVTYYRNERPSEPTKTLNSLLTLERNEAGKVVRHTEEWDHKHESSSSDGFFGAINEFRKVVTANITGAFVTKDANKVPSNGP